MVLAFSRFSELSFGVRKKFISDIMNHIIINGSRNIHNSNIIGTPPLHVKYRLNKNSYEGQSRRIQNY